MSAKISEHITRTPSIDRLVQGYLVTLRSEGKFPYTVASYEDQLTNFLWWCEKEGMPRDVDNITTAHMRSFFLYVQTERVRWEGKSASARKAISPATLHRYYKTLSVFFRWLEDEGLTSASPLQNMRKPKLPQNVVQSLTGEDLKRMLALCDKGFLGARNRAILMLFLDTGLRVSELASLDLSDVCSERGTILVRSGKGHKQRIVHMGNRCQKAVWRWATMFRYSHTDRLFVSRQGEPLEARGVKMLVKRLCQRAGISGGRGCHRLRHTFAIEFLRAGGDSMTLQHLLGHSSLEMVRRYLGSLNSEDAVKAHKRYSPADNMRLR